MPERPPRGADEALTLRDALRWATRLLASAGVESARLDAELLLVEVVGLDRAGLYARATEPLAGADAGRYSALVRRRAAREPLAYILGRRPFYDLDLEVAPGVLVPRPETEHLVEEALAWCRDAARPWRIADVGTGSGAIAVALARRLPRALVAAVDVSPEALRVARANVRRYGLEGRVVPVRGDLLAPLAGTLDVIVANLPYIPRRRLATLAPEVRDYEPRLALDGGEDGLDLIRRLLAQAPERLARPGLLLLEIDEEQGPEVTRLAREALPDAEVDVRRDLAGLDRLARIARR